MGLARNCALAALLGAGGLFEQAGANVNIDGGRSQLPGMKQDMFDQAQKNKKMGGRAPPKGPPECPKSDGMSPFWGLTFIDGELYVKMNSTDEPCQKLLTVGGANLTVLKNASLTCGPVGEWKRRIAEQLSVVFFQGGLEWVKHENETVEVVTENGTFEIGVTEEKFAEQSTCWAKGCDCDQAKSPTGRAILYSVAAIGILGLLSDTLKYGWDKLSGKKPPKHVLCKRGGRLDEKICTTHLCDLCGKRGTAYTSRLSDDKASYQYDMCKVCYKAQKKKVKDALETWYDKHPEEKKKDQEKKDKKGKKGENDSDDDDKKSEKSEATEVTEGDKQSSKGDDEKSEKSEVEAKEE